MADNGSLRRPKSCVNPETSYMQRSFAHLNVANQRSSPIEARKQVVSQMIEPITPQSMYASNSNIFNFTSSWYDIIDNSDFEHNLELQEKDAANSSDAIKKLAKYPIDDVEVKLVKRECRTESPVVPALDGSATSHLLNCVQAFTDDWTVIQHNYANKRSGVLVYNKDKKDSEDDHSLHKYEDGETKKINAADKQAFTSSSTVDLSKSEPDKLVDNVFQNTPQEDVDEYNAKLRKENRPDSLFNLFSLTSSSNLSGVLADEQEMPIEHTVPPPMPREHRGYKILVKCLSLELEVEMEPIFLTLDLYDLQHKKKISETFHFDLNKDHIKKMLHDSAPPDPSTCSRSAVFSITYPSNNIYIVIRLEKVLQQGDISDCVEPYMKEATEKSRDKARANAVWYCEKLKKYRMPFAWTGINLMNVVNKAENLKPMEEAVTTASSSDSLSSRNGTLSNQSLSESELNMLKSFKAVTLTISSFFKQEGDKLSDEDLFKYLQDLRRPTRLLKNTKCIPIKLKLDVSPCPENFAFCLTPELSKVIPYPKQQSKPTREILEFFPKEVYIPNTTYRNLMYVYPKNVNFNNRPGHARNIAIKVQLMSGEEPDKAEKAIFGKSSGKELCTEAYCTVLYHNKSPNFIDEIKFKLPANLSDKYHLLFTFYHVSCQNKKDGTPTELLVGYSWLPLLQNGHLRVGDVSLPVSMDKLPSNYSLHSSESTIPGVKWVDGRKPVFTLSMTCVSTVHTMDRHLDAFFNVSNAVDRNSISKHDDAEQRLKASMEKMANNAQLESLVRFLYIILNKLVHLLIRPPVVGGQTINVAQTCFEAICVIIMRLQKSLPAQCDAQGRNHMLASYAHYVFRPDVLHSLASQAGSEADNPLGAMGGNHYATISKVATKNRPLLNETFNLSSSNPDLTTPPNTPDQSPTQETDKMNFLRHANTRSSLMEQAQHVRTESTGVRMITKKVFHEELALLWSVSTGYVKENALQQAWFLFDLMHKSMAQHIHSTVGLTSPRMDRFPVRFLDDLARLVKIITTEIIANYSKNANLAEHLNMSLAFFLRDVLSIMNRGFVFQLITDYSQQIGTKVGNLNSPAALMSLRLSLMRIICSHEHYITLNTPFLNVRSPSPTPSIVSTASALSILSMATTNNSDYDVTDQYVKKHFLVGILLSDLQSCVELGEQVSLVGPQLYAVTTILHLMKSHDLDGRIKSDIEVKEKVTSLYMPLFMIALKALTNMHDFDSEFGSSTSLATATTEDSGFTETIDPKTANAIAASAVVTPKLGNQQALGPISPKMNPETSKKMLLCVFWLMKNSNKEALREFVSALVPLQINHLLELLYVAISCFEYKPPPTTFNRGEPNRNSISHQDQIDRLQTAILGDMSARREMLLRRRGDRLGNSLSKDDAEKGLRWRKDRTEYKKSKTDKTSAESAFVTKDLAAETTLLTVDILELIIDCATENNTVSTILTAALKLLLHCLSTNQSISVLKSVFQTQRSIIARFPELVFEEEIEQCAELCLSLLKRCSSRCDDIRTNATASLYLLMRHNYSVGNTFARVKMQITMSLSSLVGSSSHHFDEVYLRRSLRTILLYAEKDKDMVGSTFPDQVQDLMYNLHTILCDTVKMKEHQEDPEMLIDLMYRIAKGYQNSPDLRLTWLQNMAQQHASRKNHVEAGMCLLHSAALVAEYISMLEEKSYLPIGCIAFKNISFNILEESAVSDDVVSPHEDGVCTEKYFSLPGFLGLLESAIVSFQYAGIYEIVNEVYKMIIPVYEHFNDLKKLAEIHTKLHDCFLKIKNQDGKRMFGTYFRIGFYGSKFADLNGEEYIYKEPGITKLPEISHRLQNFYGNRFGANNVEVVKDSKSVEIENLDSNKAYIQITYVEPYFLKWEEERKGTYFESNFNLRRFIYSTPYTLDGKAHGAIKDQYKKKTVLEVAHTFPYMKTRNKVIKRTETILAPLETACEDVQKKSQQLLQVATQQPIDVRMLQVNLQGSVLTTVNQGPMEVAQTFLTSIPDDPKMWIPFNRLRLAFRDFDYACSLALKKNKSLVGSDQKEYQRELEKNYNSMTTKLKPLYKSNRIMELIRDATHEQLGLT